MPLENSRLQLFIGFTEFTKLLDSNTENYRFNTIFSYTTPDTISSIRYKNIFCKFDALEKAMEHFCSKMPPPKLRKIVKTADSRYGEDLIMRMARSKIWMGVNIVSYDITISQERKKRPTRWKFEYMGKTAGTLLENKTSLGCGLGL